MLNSKIGLLTTSLLTCIVSSSILANSPQEDLAIGLVGLKSTFLFAQTAQKNDTTKKSKFYRSKDGIDDDTPLPKKGTPARMTFEEGIALVVSDPKSAIDVFEKAASQTDYFYAAWYNAGYAAQISGDMFKAEEFYKRSLEVRPDYSKALINLYFLYVKLNQHQQAKELVRLNLIKYPKNSGPHALAAIDALLNNNLIVAKNESLKAIAINERSIVAMRIMAQVFFSEKKYETARFALENALSLEPGNALVRSELGEIYLALKEEKKAQEEYFSASILRGDILEADENLGVLAFNHGDYDLAEKSFTKVVLRIPKSDVAQMHYGNILREKKKYKEAERAFKKALKLNPALVAVHFNLGVLYMDNKVEDMSKLDLLESAKAEFELYLEMLSEDKEDIRQKVESYLKTLKKRIRREQRKLKRKAEKEAIAREEKLKQAEDGQAQKSDSKSDENTTEKKED